MEEDIKIATKAFNLSQKWKASYLSARNEIKYIQELSNIRAERIEELEAEIAKLTSLLEGDQDVNNS